VLVVDEIIALDRGSVLERGSHAELLPLHAAYARRWARETGLRLIGLGVFVVELVNRQRRNEQRHQDTSARDAPRAVLKGQPIRLRRDSQAAMGAVEVGDPEPFRVGMSTPRAGRAKITRLPARGNGVRRHERGRWASGRFIRFR
jgi:hypothetical protein